MPEWNEGQQPKHVLLDGEGLGHTPKLVAPIHQLKPAGVGVYWWRRCQTNHGLNRSGSKVSSIKKTSCYCNSYCINATQH